MNIKMKLFIALLVCVVVEVTAQDDARLMLENKYYGDNNNVNYVVQINPHIKGTEWRAEKMLNETAMHGLRRKSAFTKVEELDGGLTIRNLLSITSYQYLFVLTLNQAEKIFLRKTNKLYLFSADIECIDVITGQTVLFDSFDWVSEEKNDNESERPFNDKPFKDFLNSVKNSIASHAMDLFPIVPTISSMVEVKKDKVKKVGISNKKYGQIGKPKELRVYRVVDKVEVDGKLLFTYSMVGKIFPTKKVDPKGIRTMSVGDGKKEILKYFNSGEQLYITTKLLGDDE